jgi:hypothetical protein
VVVLGRFESVPPARDAAQAVVKWAADEAEVKLGPVSVISRDEQGELFTENFGRGKRGKGAKVGVGVGALAAVLSGGLTLIPTAIAGALLGGAGGSLARDRVQLTSAELERIWGELEGGRGILVVQCQADDVAAVSGRITASGGHVDAGELEPAPAHAEPEEGPELPRE